MSVFDPFAGGGATEVGEKPTGFDPFSTGAATAEAPGPKPEQDSSPKLGNRWLALYGGLDGMDQRLMPDEKVAFSDLDRVTDNSKMGRAQAINQAYLTTQLPDMTHAYIERNWPEVKAAYAKQQFGLVDKEIPDTKLYSAISKRIQESERDVDGPGEMKPWTWKDQVGADIHSVKKGVTNFWEGINKPLVEIPDAPHDLPDLKGLGLYNPALAGGVFNALKPLVEGAESPLGVATLGTGGSLSEAAKIYPLAKAALVSMTGVFTGLMGYGTVKAVIKAPDVLKDPNSSFQDRVEAVVAPAADAGATLLGAVGMALEMFPKEQGAAVAKEMAGKNPAQAAEILRKEAAETEIPNHNKALNNAAVELDKINNEFSVAANDALVPPPEPQPVKENTTLGSLVGKKITYAGYDGTLIRDEEGNFLLLRGVRQKGQAAEIIIEDTGKTPNILADEVRVSPKQGWDVGREQEKAAVVETGEVPQTPQNKARVREPVAALPKTPKEGETAPQAKETAKDEPLTGISNAAVDAELKEMGLDPAEHGETTTQKAEQAKAQEILKDDPFAGQKLIDELAEKNRPVTPTETMVALNELNRLQIEREKVQTALDSAEPEAKPALREQARVAQSAYEKAADVVTKFGTVGAQAMAMRNAMLKRDYTLAGLERRYKAALNERPYTEAEQKEVADLHAKIAALDARISAYDKAQEEARLRPVREAPRRPKPPSKVSEFITKQADAARTRLKEKMSSGRVSSGIDPTDIADHAIIGADYIAKGVTKFADWSVAMVNELGEHIRPFLQDIFNQSIQARDDASKLQAYKSRTISATKKIEAQLAADDFTPAKKNPLRLDDEAQRLRAERQRARDLADARIRYKEKQNRSPLEKISDGFLQLRKVGLISGIKTAGKVGIAGQTRIGMTLADTASGAILNKLPVLGEIAEGAPREGGKTGKTVESAAKGYAEGWVYAANEAWKVLKTGKTDAEVLAGANRSDPTILNVLVNTHALLKLPAFAQEYKISLRERTAFELKKGTDMTNPLNQLQVNTEAVQDGLRAKFSQDNFLTSRMQMLTESLKHAKEHPTTGKIIAAAMNFIFPIVKIPANFFAEAATYGNLGAGLPRAVLKTVEAMRTGVEKLTPVQKDSIMRHWKKGSIGAGLILAGYYLRNDIGGYYQPGKKDASKPEFGGIRLFGQDIPRWMVHMPIMEPLHFGATMGHVMDHINKKTGEEGSKVEALFAGVTGMLDEIPYVSGAKNISQALDQDGRGKYARGELVKGAIVPRLVSEVAELADTDAQGNPVKRKTDTVIQHVQAGLPGLRKNLPERNIDTTFSK